MKCLIICCILNSFMSNMIEKNINFIDVFPDIIGHPVKCYRETIPDCTVNFFLSLLIYDFKLYAWRHQFREEQRKRELPQCRCCCSHMGNNNIPIQNSGNRLFLEREKKKHSHKYFFPPQSK